MREIRPLRKPLQSRRISPWALSFVVCALFSRAQFDQNQPNQGEG
jgi:hypothetical protein